MHEYILLYIVKNGYSHGIVYFDHEVKAYIKCSKFHFPKN